MRWIPILCLLLVPPCLADILYLQDGSRYSGDLIRESPTEVVFRVMADAQTGIIRAFPRSQVARIERGSRQDAEARQREEPSEDFVQMYREAIELFHDSDLRAALLALQRMVNRAPEETLQQIDRRVKRERGQTLPDLIARLRMEQALDNEKGLFRLRYASRYEAPALATRLTRLHDGLLERSFHDRSLRAWVEDPQAYRKLQSDAPEMVRDLRILAGVLGSRLKIDRTLREDRAARTALAGLRRGAGQLIARIEALPGYTNLRGVSNTTTDPTLAAAEALTTSQPSQDEATPDGQAGEELEPEETRADAPVPDGPAEPDQPR